MSRPLTPQAALVSLFLLTASCGGSTVVDSAPATIGGASVSTTTSVVQDGPDTSAVQEDPPADISPTPTEPAEPELFSLAEVGADGLLGSGCTPGTDTLPDGIWFGNIVSWSDGFFAFDLMCNYIGSGTSEATIRNDNPKLRTVLFDADAVVTVRIDDGYLMTIDEFADFHPTVAPNERLVIIEVIGGQAARLELTS